MSGWLNFNESLNTLKGQISTFANNVLAENDEGTEPAETNLEELKNLYIQKETEIENLKKINEELQRCLRWLKVVASAFFLIPLGIPA